MDTKNVFRLFLGGFITIFAVSNVIAGTIVDPRYDVKNCNWTNSRTTVVGNIYKHTEDYRCTRVRDNVKVTTAVGTLTRDLNTINTYWCSLTPRSPYKWKNASSVNCYAGQLVEPTIYVPESCGPNAGRVYRSNISSVDAHYENARAYCGTCTVLVAYHYQTGLFTLSCGN